MKKTLIKRLTTAFHNPNEALVKLLLGWVNHLRGFSYDLEKNGEMNLLAKLRDLEPKIIFDVGSNIGEWSKIALEIFPDAEIHAFELSPSTFKTLSQNLGHTSTIINNFGMADWDGEVKFKDYGENSPVSTILTMASYHDHRIISEISKSKVMTGNTYCTMKRIEFIDILKIDVEGAEHLVLNGFSEFLKKKKIRIIQFEYGYTNGDAKFLMRDFYNLFENYGYIVGRLSKKGISFEAWNYKMNEFRSGPNYVAVRSDDLQLKTHLEKF